MASLQGATPKHGAASKTITSIAWTSAPKAMPKAVPGLGGDKPPFVPLAALEVVHAATSALRPESMPRPISTGGRASRAMPTVAVGVMHDDSLMGVVPDWRRWCPQSTYRRHLACALPAAVDGDKKRQRIDPCGWDA